MKIPNKIFNLVNRKYLLILIAIFVALFLFTGVYSASSIGIDSIDLITGKNQVRFNLTEPFYVKDLVKWNPTISVVSYIEENKTVGYVNLFNGIGDNFVIDNDKDYEVILNKNISLVLPPGARYIKEGD
jgi:hypothetical protein